MHTGAARRSHTRLRLAGLVLGLSHFAGCATTQESPKVSEAAARWAADLAKFEEQVGGKWDVREEENEAGTRRTVFEVGDNPVIKGWGEGGEKQARAIADKLLESNAKLLRIAGLATEMHMVGRTGKAFAFVYSVGQPHAKHRRIPILGARVDVRIHELGRILLLRSDVPELAEDPLPEKPADQAQFDELDKKAAQACDLSQPRVDGDKRGRRVWSIGVPRGNGRQYRSGKCRCRRDRRERWTSSGSSICRCKGIANRSSSQRSSRSAPTSRPTAGRRPPAIRSNRAHHWLARCPVGAV